MISTCKGTIYVYERLARFVYLDGIKWTMRVYSGDELLFESSHFTKDTLSREWTENFKNLSGELLKVSKYYRTYLVMNILNDYPCGI